MKLLQHSTPGRIPVTGRSAETIAAAYGYDEITALAESLPPEAKIADVGSGYSKYGVAMCELRPDIQWSNLDISYTDALLNNDLNQKSPDNLSFEQLDVLSPSAVHLEAYDRVFSYWMLPHITRLGYMRGVRAARNILRMCKPNGVAIVGPRVVMAEFIPKMDHVRIVQPAKHTTLKALRVLEATTIDTEGYIQGLSAWMNSRSSPAISARELEKIPYGKI